MARQRCWIARFHWLLLCIAVNGNGQCPDPVIVRQKIKQARTEPVSNWQVVFDRLKDDYKTCRLAADSNYANILFSLAYAHSLNRQFEQASQLTQRCIAINESGRANVNPVALANNYHYSGVYLTNLNRNTDAIEAYQKSIQAGRNQRINRAIVGQSLRNLTLLYYTQGDYEKSLNSADLGYTYCRAGKDTLAMSACLYVSARSLWKLGQLSIAEKQIRQAIWLVNLVPTALIEKNSYKSTLAEFLFLKHQPDEGLRLCEELIRSYEQQQAFDEAAYVYNNVGYQYLSVLKEYGKALHYFEQAYRHFTYPDEKANTLSNIALVYAEQKNYPKALSYLQKSLTTFPIGFRGVAVTSNPSLSEIRSASFKEKLLSILQDKADTWLNYARASNNHQRLRYALDTYKVADQMIDFMRWEHTGQLSKLFWRDKTRGMYERAIETCYQLGDREQAFRFMEKSRAVMLADKLNELGARQQLANEQVAEEQQLRQRVSDGQTKLAGLTPDSARYAPMRMALLASQDSLDGFLKQLEASNPAYYRYKYDNVTPSLTDLQQYLKQQQSSLVTYFVGDSALYVMAVTGSTTTLRKQSVGVYTPTLRQFASLLTNADAMRKTTDVSRFLTLSNSLFRQLLAPLALPKGRVVVSPDGSFIPFDALSRSATQPRYAVYDYAFSYVYSASLLLKKKEMHRQLPGLRTRDFLGVAPVDFAPSLKQVLLPGSDVALKPIAGRFASSTLLTHEAATRQAFLTQAATARIIHLFTHAVADTTGQEPTLYFADSTLQLADLGDGALPNAELVVLAACKTGIGANQRGEGVFSLARGFAALGVPSVLTTLWSVQTEATYQLTDLFYRYLDQGLPKDIALQRAKQDWLEAADGASQLPNYWAGLIIVGDAEPLSQTHYGLWMAGLAILLVGGLGGFWVWQKRNRRTIPAVSVAHSA